MASCSFNVLSSENAKSFVAIFVAGVKRQAQGGTPNSLKTQEGLVITLKKGVIAQEQVLLLIQSENILKTKLPSPNYQMNFR